MKIILFCGSFAVLILLGEMYLKNNEIRIKKNIKIGTAHIYRIDTKTRYGHFRVWYDFKISEKSMVSTNTIRDDLNKSIFIKLENQSIQIVFDSTNPKRYNALLITNDDYLKYGIKKFSN